jgi:hypothetical protein
VGHFQAAESGPLRRLKAEIRRRCGISISISRLSILLRNLQPPEAGRIPAAKPTRAQSPRGTGSRCGRCGAVILVIDDECRVLSGMQALLGGWR